MSSNKSHDMLAVASIRDEALDMAVGENRSICCPFCEATHEKSCSLTRQPDGILYHCFRVKCQARGFIGTAVVSATRKKREFERREFRRPLKSLPEDLVGFLGDKYGLCREDIQRARFKFDFTENRLYMPILTEMGLEAGAVSKSLDGRIPKTLNYFWSPLCNLHVADSPVKGGPVVLVEDILSATKVGRQARCVALLGTSLNADGAIRVKQLSTSILVALDGDTWRSGKSLGHKLKEKYGLLFENFSVVRLSNRDPKEMTDEEIRSVILSGIREENSGGDSS